MVSLGYAVVMLCGVVALACAALGVQKKVVVACAIVMLCVVRITIAAEAIEYANHLYEIGEPRSFLLVAEGNAKRKDEYVSFVARDIATNARLFIRGRSEDDIYEGDEIRIVGSIAPDAYHRGVGVVYGVVAQKISVDTRAVPPVGRRIREWFVNNIQRIVAEPEAAFVAGVTVGEEGALPEQVMQAFRTTGTAHVLVASGYNVSIVASVLIAVCGTVSFVAGIVGATLGIVLYAVVAGGGASVVRSAIMALVVLLARVLGRPRSSFRALVYAGLLMFAWNPYIIFDVGFQLSVTATAGILFLPKYLAPYFARVPEIFGIRESLVVTCAAILGVFPVTLLTFGTVSLVAPFVNVVIAPFVPLVMACGGIAGVLESFIPLLAYLPAWIAYLASRVVIETVTYSAAIPYASVEVSKHITVVALCLYVVLLCGLIIASRRS